MRECALSRIEDLEQASSATSICISPELSTPGVLTASVAVLPWAGFVRSRAKTEIMVYELLGNRRPSNDPDLIVPRAVA